MKADKLIKGLLFSSVFVIFGGMGYMMYDNQHSNINDDSANISQRDENGSGQSQSVLDRAREKMKDKYENEEPDSRSTNSSPSVNSSIPNSLNDSGHIKPFKKKGVGIDSDYDIETGDFKTGSELNNDLSSDINKIQE